MAQIKEWAMDPNIRNFAVSLLVIGMVCYISKGEGHHEKLHRVLIGALVLVVTAFILAVIYGFSK